MKIQFLNFSGALEKWDELKRVEREIQIDKSPYLVKMLIRTLK